MTHFDLVTIDVTDTIAAATFWSAALGLHEIEHEDKARWIALADQAGRRTLGLQRGPHRSTAATEWPTLSDLAVAASRRGHETTARASRTRTQTSAQRDRIPRNARTGRTAGRATIDESKDFEVPGLDVVRI